MTKHWITALVIVGALVSGAEATALASAPPDSVQSASMQSATQASAAAPSGEAMPVGNLPGWRQIFTDDFTTDVPLGSFPGAVSSKWSAYPSPWKDTSKFGTYSPAKVISVHDGILDKNIHTENGVAMVAAIQPKLAVPVTYGRYAVRFRFDSTVGYKIAWMLWPDSNNNERDGEIDFPEMNLTSNNAMAFNHHTNSTGAGDQDWFKAGLVPGSWHTAVIEWSPNLAVFRFDGVEIGRTTERVAKTAMHWVLQTETDVHLTAPPAASARGNVQIDWAAVWAYDPTSTGPIARTTIDGQYSGSGKIAGGVETTMKVTDRGGVPSTGVGAVALNVTVTEPSAASYLTVWPTNTPRPLASNLNFGAGQTVANAVLTKVGADGSISIFNNAGDAHVVVDVLGWFPDNQSFVGLTPARLADTRNSPTVDGQAWNTGPVPQAGFNNVTVVGRGGVPVSGVGAVALNVTATDATSASFLTVWPTGAARPTASTLNVVAGQSVPNMVIAKVGTDGQVSIYNDLGSVNVVVDVLGWFPAGNSYNAMVPARVLDTRSASPIVDGITTDVQIAGQSGGPPAGTTAVALNVTVTQPAGASYLTVWPSGSARPLSSNLNFVGGETVPNMVIVKLGTNGKVSLFTESPAADVVVDVLGWFSSSGSFTGLAPARLMDSRGAS